MRGHQIVDALGTRVGIELAGLDDDAVAAVEKAWRDASATEGAAAVTVTPRSTKIPSLLSSLSQRVTHAALDERAGELWLLHASGVALPDGRVVVFVAPSGGGKTTLSARVGTEYGYVSDEAIGIDDSGRVLPYRKPLSIIEDGTAPKAQRAPSDLGLLPLPGPDLRVGAIVLLDRRVEEVDEPRIEAVDLEDVLMELVTQSSYLARMPAPLQSIARIVDLAGGVLRLTYSGAGSLSPLIPAIVDHVDGGTPTGEPRLVERDVNTDGRAYFRGETLDAIEFTDRDRVAVLQVDEQGQGMVRVLAGIAPTLWRAADGASRDDLLQAAVDQHGEPDGADAATLVDAALNELTDSGVLELRHPRWQIRADVAWTDGAGGRVAALPLTGGSSPPLLLDGPAGLVWSALSEGAADETELASRVAELAGLAPETVADDVAGFLRELERTALATRS